MTIRNLPQHVAIIMDGNGRWAAVRKKPRFHGHVEGVKRVEEIVEAAGRMGIKILTLFAFSTENWHRPRQEVSMLMATLCSVLEQKGRKLFEGNVRLHFIGRREGAPVAVIKSIEKTMELTKHNDGLVLNLAFNYGSRLEIVDAIRAIASRVDKGKLSVDEITEETVDQSLYTVGMPDPDLLIRTSGEQRISNFLLWQLSYAEFYFTETFWPDFNEKEFRKAIDDYQHRERRFGKVKAVQR